MASVAVRSLLFARSVRLCCQTTRSSCLLQFFSPFSLTSSLETRSSTGSRTFWSYRWGLGRALTTAREFSKAARTGSGHRDGRAGRIRSVSDEVSAVTDEDESEEDDREREPRSKNQRKRDSSRARHWGVELASCTPAQVKQAVRWAGLSDEVYDAVILVKNLGTSSRVRNGRRRQLNYIGGLLRDVDPDVMEPVLKAAKNGDSDGIIVTSLPSIDSTEEEESSAEDDEEEDEAREDPVGVVAERWLEGVIAGDSTIEDEIYSIFDVEFDRQELRKLVRTAQKTSTDEDESNKVGSGKSHVMLKSFLVNIARQQAENQALYS